MLGGLDMLHKLLKGDPAQRLTRIKQGFIIRVRASCAVKALPR